MAVGENEQARIEFIRSAINEHRESHAYKTAADAEEYYNGLNPTINRYEKIIYDMQGRSHTDMWTANHKLASRFFGLAVDQEVSYLLGNGVTFAEKETPKNYARTSTRKLWMRRVRRKSRACPLAFGI